MFAIFSFLGKTVSRYILPLYPAASLLVAGTWINGYFRRTISVALGFLAVIWGVILFSVNLFGLAVKNWQGELDPLLVSIIEKHLSLNRIEINIVSVLLIILGLIGMFKAARRIRLVILAAIMVTSLIMFVTHWMPIEKEYYSPKPFCEMMKRVVPVHASICAYKSWENTIRFYFGRHIECIPHLYDRSRDEYAEQDILDFINSFNEVYCLMWDKVYEKLSSEMKQKINVVARGYKVLEHNVVLVSNK